MDKLVERGIVRKDSRVTLADSVLGVGVKQGAPKPDVSTLEAFKKAMLNARAVVYSQAGASGIYFTKMCEKLGIADEVLSRAVTIPMGFTGEKVVSGEADVAIQQISELMTVPGIDIAGPFPPEIQTKTQFDAAIFNDATNLEGATAFLNLLKSPAAAKAYGDGGLVSLLA
jgi:molybdate transport system substrate-binding protein